MQAQSAADAVGERRSRERRRFAVRGVVQGVGFRPFVYTLARELGLSGLVGNNAAGVYIEVEGCAERIATFEQRLGSDAPPLALIDAVTSEQLPCRPGTDFVIEDSSGGGGRTLVSPDVATCSACWWPTNSACGCCLRLVRLRLRRLSLPSLRARSSRSIALISARPIRKPN